MPERDEALIPARMVNEFTYCPRLFFLEWVDAEFDDNHFTVDGRVAHDGVDGPRTKPLGEADVPWQARSVELSSAALGVSGKIDLVESAGGEVYPVDVIRRTRAGPELWILPTHRWLWYRGRYPF